MQLIGKARINQKIEDFDYYNWWVALVAAGISPSEAWKMDFIETSYVLDIEMKTTDTSLALYHQRIANGASKECLLKN